MRKRVISLILTAVLFISMVPTVAVYAADSGEPSAWAQAEVDAAIAAGLVPEDFQQDYKSQITRGAVALILRNLIEKAAGMTVDDLMAEKGVTLNARAFSDVSDFYPADRAILAVNALGIVNGVGGGRFDPKGTLTRAQLAAIMNRTANVLGIKTTGYSHSFTDMRGHWAESELGWPVHAGLINGVGGSRFDPNGQLTMEQAISITFRSLEPLTEGASEPAAPAGDPAIATDRGFYNPDDKITVTAEGITEEMYDDSAFVGLYYYGAGQNDYTTRKYLSAQSDTLEFSAPEDYGVYELRLHSSDYQSDETLLATCYFTVTGPIYQSATAKKPAVPQVDPTVPEPPVDAPSTTPEGTGGQPGKVPGEGTGGQPGQGPGTDPNRPVTDQPKGTDDQPTDPPRKPGENGPKDKPEQDDINKTEGKDPIPESSEADRIKITELLNGSDLGFELNFTGTREHLYSYARSDSGLMAYVSDNISGKYASQRRSKGFMIWKQNVCKGVESYAEMKIGQDGKLDILSLRANGVDNVREVVTTLPDGSNDTLIMDLGAISEVFMNYSTEPQYDQFVFDPEECVLRGICGGDPGTGFWSTYEFSFYLYIDSGGYLCAEGTGVRADNYTKISHCYYKLRTEKPYAEYMGSGS